MLTLLFFNALTALALDKPSLSMARIEALIQTKKPKSSAEFLKLLPDECKRFYNLVYSSRSLQNSSTMSPRIITACTTKNLKLVLAFADPALNEGKDSVEILSVDPKSQKLNPTEIVFSPEGPKLRKNPTECASCHGKDTRIIWDDYGFWRHTYNSSHRQVPVNSSEWKQYQDYKKQPKHPLYSQLVPYLETDEGEGNRDLKFNIEKPILDDAFGTLKPGNKYLSATSFFHNLLIAQHQKTVKNIFREHPQGPTFAYAMAALSLGGNVNGKY